jgi:hypothetical protein
VVPVGAGTLVLEVALPSGLASETVVACVNDALVPVNVTAGVARFDVPGLPETRATWRLAVE